MILFGNQVVIVILIAAACGAAAAAFILYRMYKNNPNSRMNVLAAGIRMNAQQFSGMYEPMYALAHGSNVMERELFAAWHERVFACDEDNGFKAIYTNMFGDFQKWGQKGPVKARKIAVKKAKKLVKIFARAGILRNQETVVAGSETTAEYYDLAGGGVIYPGVAYEVLTPYWHLGEDVLDRGIVRYR